MTAFDNLRNQFNQARSVVTTNSQTMRTELAAIRKQQNLGFGLNLGIGKFRILAGGDDETDPEEGGMFANFRARIEEMRANFQKMRNGEEDPEDPVVGTYQPRAPLRDITLQPRPPQRGITLS